MTTFPNTFKHFQQLMCRNISLRLWTKSIRILFITLWNLSPIIGTNCNKVTLLNASNKNFISQSVCYFPKRNIVRAVGSKQSITTCASSSLDFLEVSPWSLLCFLVGLAAKRGDSFCTWAMVAGSAHKTQQNLPTQCRLSTQTVQWWVHRRIQLPLRQV